ncbi:MAG: hypothetical protein H0U85_07885 [Gemmatimonadales bacterium]|nr:hypothetical protein [Gemmatimonadales bacterium]
MCFAAIRRHLTSLSEDIAVTSNVVRGAFAAILLAVFARPGHAQRASDSTLSFFGFRPGARIRSISAVLDSASGSRLRCDRAKADPRVTECRAVVSDPGMGGPVDLWVSAIDSISGIMTLSARVSPDQLDEWRGALERSYGRVGAKVQGNQWMMQWVRRGRMIRLTWRLEKNERVASVSLVDGHVLDNWHRTGKSARGG